MSEKIEQLSKWIQESNNLVVFSGAGMSTSSGIPDFRSTNGLWKAETNREYYISKGYYQSNPKDFWQKFKEIFQLKLMGDYQPNEGHYFLKELEDMGKNVTILTQNVDGLHTDAGSSHVIELHGTIKTATCPKCKTQYGLDYINNHDIPRCNKPNKKNNTCGFILKPDVVLFGDAVRGYKEAEEAINACSLFVVLGSSLEVYPVNNLPQYARYDENTKLTIINREATKKDRLFDLVLHEDIVATLSKVKEFLHEGDVMSEYR
ncbi:NAD-dependent protein deacylase [Bacillus sp. M6-12]|uniref:NAD-dependent protein deacylase n=1 Tax=Bacillus sp. M6-12 TaxID=2054166 RepID=UPI000C785075|nr:NAD-dependent protein deacylase [Bacillus sp. M6-12]PLS18877.1 NAD-dependent protein deacylase [Bacillus sp. M6-12]